MILFIGAASHTRVWFILESTLLLAFTLSFLVTFATADLCTQNLNPRKFALSLPICVILVFSKDSVNFSSLSKNFAIASLISDASSNVPTIPTTQSSAYLVK